MYQQITLNFFSPVFTIGRLLLVLLTLSVSNIVLAQSDCEPGAREQQRRRPGQLPAECIDQPTSQQPSQTDGSKNPTAAGAAQPTNRNPARKPNPVSPLPKPNLQDYPPSIPVPDRWRIVDALYAENWWDPYNRNFIKGDKPVYDDWFFSFTGISDSVLELRSVPTPVGSSSTGESGQLNVIGSGDQLAFNQNFLTEFVFYKGNTTFKPPDYEFRFTPAFNYNYLKLDEVQGVNANPIDGDSRNDGHVGLQAAFFDYHIRNVSDQYDFDSVRLGIQPFTNDFRGFLFIDSPFGLRLFGTRNNNVFQYNLAWFRRMEKDTNSGLNDVGESLRDDDTFVANLYWQDMFKKGLTSQFSILHNRNDEKEFFYDDNDFIVRPASLGLEKLRDYQVTYLGFAMDGHYERLNLSTQIYFAFGEESPSFYRDASTDIAAFFLAAEPSVDFDWLRIRGSMIYGSGDKNPFDDKSTGFDAILENPQIAGADTSYWIRQAVPLIGGGRIALSGRNGVLNSLRSSKDQGQSNFTNPGLRLLGLGFDADILPELRLSGNWNYLQFDETAVLETARNQADIEREIGHDISVSLTYRPNNIQNIVLRASYAKLLSGDGFESLYGADKNPDYFLLNIVLTY